MKDEYIMGCDPYDRLNYIQRLLKKVGFYKNRPKSSTTIVKISKDGVVEQIFNK